MIAHPRSPAIPLHVLLLSSEPSRILQSLLLVLSGLDAGLYIVIWIGNALRRGLSCSCQELLVALSACIVREIDDGLEITISVWMVAMGEEGSFTLILFILSATMRHFFASASCFIL